MRLLLFIFLFSLIGFCSAQDKIHYSLSINANNSFLEGKRAGIKDYYGYRSNAVNPGFGLGATFLWTFHESFNLSTGTLLSFETQAYGYYSLVKQTNAVTKIHIPLFIRYNIPSKSKNNFFIDLGGNFSLSLDDSFSKSERGGSEFVPDFETSSQSNSGFYPTILVGVGWRCFTPGNRMMEYLFTFHKGFISSKDYELKNLDTQVVSTFGFKETLLKFQVNWYFKHRKHG